MQKVLSVEEAMQDSFLFVSYSHDEQETVASWVEYLRSKGVRAWWDKAFQGGDDWQTLAEKLLNHENCCGILFFASKSAIASENVAKEWRAAANAKKQRTDGSFYAQIIMATDDAEVDYKYLTRFVKKNDEVFSDEDFDDFRALFGEKDHLYYCAGKEADKDTLLKTVKARVPGTVDEYELVRDKLTGRSDMDPHGAWKLGKYGDGRKALSWSVIRQEDKEVTLLCQEILTEDFGGRQTEDRLRQLVQEAFTADEQDALQIKIRLLTREEAETVTREALAAGKLWWLADCDGNLQAVVREDGTVYANGYNNKRYAKGIRPVITVDAVGLCNITKK